MTRPDARPIPTIDLSDLRSTIIDQVSGTCCNFGFFQITNHSIPLVVLDSTIAAVKASHEQPTTVKARFYSREMGQGVSYLSNVDLYTSRDANWHDTLQVRLGPTPAAVDEVPEICRDEIVAWNKEIQPTLLEDNNMIIGVII
ncbi:putative non-heme dioxygenase domain, isopenicillin N synthase [Rosa chinensis]|uniref:Putative non-heme dioxygenase domain, isopenicillin N synthase n=1 Tax=Rosa chinensis TaxID=74649 RepID=A0A2P6SC15_ROSCH|nr:putative non-heme dioxygenase domain, isopenicillin N synthase [Rosa chinensis]